MSRLVRACLAMLAVAAFALPATAATTTNRPPAEHFFNSPSFTAARLSPSGTHLAVRLRGSEPRDRLAVIDLATGKAEVVAFLHDSNIGQFDWVNNERLVFDSREKVGAGDAAYWPGLWAVNRDGSNLRQLAQIHPYQGRDKFSAKQQPYNTTLAGTGAQDSDNVYVVRYDFEGNGYEIDSLILIRLNTLTGHSERVKRPPHAKGWYFDAKGLPRLVYSTKDKEASLYYLDPKDGEDAEWKKIASFDMFDERDPIEPVGFAADGSLYVRAYNGADKQALYRLDIATGKLDKEPLVRLADFDFAGRIVVRDRTLGIQYSADADSAAWFDPKMKAIQDKIDQLLPATTNRLSLPRYPKSPWILVYSDSDRQPPVYRLYNTETGLLNEVAQLYPKLNPLEMGKTQFVRYKARDGMEIPGWLTIPHGSTGKNLPVVVSVHGGPWVRGRNWGWESDTQFLASRGYAVFQPDFRGTEGYGFKHFRSSWKQWGLKMQDDVADGTRWLIEQGIADPKRICIFGGSYGGYAAMMGMVNDPDLYKCAINFAGVTDINLMYSGHWSMNSDMSAVFRKHGMPKMIGDKEKDAAQLKATSPIEQAARIKGPVLLGYGGSDVRVPIYHGRLFHEAVKKTNPNVEWVLYPEEGHGFAVDKNAVDFYTRVEAFLDKHIGK